MKRRLALVGIDAISNVVDITNYILKELGQPMHAFDLSTIAGNKIVVKRANDGDEFEIEQIPFIAYVRSTGQNILCNISDKKLINNNGTLVFYEEPPEEQIPTKLYMSANSLAILLAP